MEQPTAASQISAASALIGDPSKFGRVAEDGTVYVITPEGERAVGSYPGKSNEEALAYFVRKFEALASEVALLSSRIKSGALLPEDAMAATAKLREQVATLNGVGDLKMLAAAVDQIPSLVESHKEVYLAKKAADDQARELKRKEAAEHKEKLVAEAESLALSESWKVAGERLKVLLDEWKAAARLDKKSDAELWKRFSSARNKFDKRRRTYFAQLESQGQVVASAKSAIVAEAKALADSKDWIATANRFKELMESWKAAGRGKKSTDTKLWEEFKAAQDQFFTAKKADLERRQGSMVANLAKREELIPAFEALLPITDLKAARKSFNELMEKWERIGITDRAKRAALEARIQKIEDEISALQGEEARRSDPTAIAHAKSVVAGLEEAIAGYQKAAAKAEAAGDTKKAAAAREAIAARQSWLDEAKKGLSTFSI
jgi:hypothetical protein